MIDFPRWKYWLVGLVMVLGVLYAAPNVFRPQLAVQIVANRDAKVDFTDLVMLAQTYNTARPPPPRRRGAPGGATAGGRAGARAGERVPTPEPSARASRP